MGIDKVSIVVIIVNFNSMYKVLTTVLTKSHDPPCMILKPGPHRTAAAAPMWRQPVPPGDRLGALFRRDPRVVRI